MYLRISVQDKPAKKYYVRGLTKPPTGNQMFAIVNKKDSDERPLWVWLQEVKTTTDGGLIYYVRPC